MKAVISHKLQLLSHKIDGCALMQGCVYELEMVKAALLQEVYGLREYGP